MSTIVGQRSGPRGADVLRPIEYHLSHWVGYGVNSLTDLLPTSRSYQLKATIDDPVKVNVEWEW